MAKGKSKEVEEEISTEDSSTKIKLSKNASIMEKLCAKYGQGSIKKASSFEKVSEVTPTGSVLLDRAIGIGGIPKSGKITQIIAPESVGKTTLALSIIANEQKKGNPCLFLDIEGTLDLKYAQSLGVNLDLLYVVDPIKLKKKEVSGEEWLLICADAMASNEFGLIVLDSVAALTPRAELEDEWNNTMGKLSRMLSQGFRTITTKSFNSKSGLILINQLRNVIGNMFNPTTEAGGNSLKYYTSLKIELSRTTDRDTSTKKILGHTIKARITKNKLALPYGVAEFYVPLGKGISEAFEIKTLALEMRIITKEKNTYSFNDLKRAVGEANLVIALEEDRKFFEEVKELVVEQLNNKEVEIITPKEISLIEIAEGIAEELNEDSE